MEKNWAITGCLKGGHCNYLTKFEEDFRKNPPNLQQFIIIPEEWQENPIPPHIHLTYGNLVVITRLKTKEQAKRILRVLSGIWDRVERYGGEKNAKRLPVPEKMRQKTEEEIVAVEARIDMLEFLP